MELKKAALASYRASQARREYGAAAAAANGLGGAAGAGGGGGAGEASTPDGKAARNGNNMAETPNGVRRNQPRREGGQRGAHASEWNGK